MRNIKLIKGLAVGIILLFVGGAFIPVCSAQISITQANGEKTSPELPINKVKHTNNDDEGFFTFAIIWGTFEERFVFSFFGNIIVHNRAPWYNRTMNVIGYSWEHQWYFKKSWCVECYALHVGIVGKHWLCVISIGDIQAFP